ncbi:hypothetical protein JHK84_028072 [Glycine max]|nr:hypothetical protein JHK84_028072 [Glycine max]
MREKLKMTWKLEDVIAGMTPIDNLQKTGMPWVSSWAAGGRDSGGFASKLFSKTCIVPQFMVVLE